MLAPAEVAAREGIFRARVTCHERGKVLACARTFGDALGFGPYLILFNARVDRHQNVRDAVLGNVAAGKAGLFGEVGIDFALGNLNLFVNFTLAQSLRRNFVANFIAEGRKGDAVG